MAHLSYHKPDLPILAPRPLKQSLGSPLTPRRPNFSQIEIALSNEDLPSLSTTKLLAVPSSRLPPESFEDKPEIRELYLEAEEELKEIVEGFTHTFVHNLLSREGSQGSDRKNLWGGDEEDDDDFESDRSMLEDEYFSPFTSGAASRAETASPDIFAMEGLPRLGGSPSPMPTESLSSDIRNYYFLDEEEFSWDYYDAGQGDDEEGMYDDINEEEVEETRRLFNESRWMTETPPITRASNPVWKNDEFGRRRVVLTAKNVVAPSSTSSNEEGERQRRKRIMSEPPQKPSLTSIECF